MAALIGPLVAVVIVAILLAALLWRKRQRDSLRERFGPEYERTIDLTGSRHEAEQELRERERRRDSLQIRPLPPDARERYLDDWRDVQRRVVDAPAAAARERARADHRRDARPGLPDGGLRAASSRHLGGPPGGRRGLPTLGRPSRTPTRWSPR